MAFTPTVSTQTDAKSPIDEALMDTGLRLNSDDHETRILALEGAAAPAGSLSEESLTADILVGLQTNTAKLKRKRFPVIGTSGSNFKKEFFDGASDITQEELATRWVGPFDNDTANARVDDVQAFGGVRFQLGKNNKISFKIKQGENYFALIYSRSATTSDSIVVTVDGLAVNHASLALTDENLSAHGATFSSTLASEHKQATLYFFGLDGKEHHVTIENTDSGTNQFVMEGIEVGFMTPEATVAIAHDDIVISEGKANVKDSEVTIAEETLSFTPASGYGRTDAYVSNKSGTTAIVEGVEPAMTQVRAEQTISAGASSVKVKNHYYFPATGFCSIGTPFGQKAIFSYTTKTNGSYANFDDQSFDGVVWQSELNDFTALTGFAVAGDFVGDYTINLVGTGGLSVATANNKIDFKVKTDNDVSAATYAATVATGLYAADLVPLERAIINALNTAKPLPDGSYFAEYNSVAHKWSIGISGSASVSEFELLFSSGANFANSIHGDLGFANTDLSGKLSFVATNEKEHLVARAQELGQFETPESPNVKFDGGAEIDGANNSALNRLGFHSIHYHSTIATTNTVLIYTDPDATGCMVYFGAMSDGSYVTASIDEGQQIYLLTNDVDYGLNEQQTAKVLSAYVSFPRGSHSIRLTVEDTAFFAIAPGTIEMLFLGFRQLKSRPALEKLTTDQAILRQFQIAPYRLFKSVYADDYTPQASFDNVDTITYGGGFSGAADTTLFNGRRSSSNTINDTADLQFTLVGDGGGVAIMHDIAPSLTKQVQYFINAAAAASETATKLIQVNNYERQGSNNPDFFAFQHLGLPAGTYTLRMKNLEALSIGITAFAVIDTVDPDENAVNVGEITNTGQSVSYPVNVIQNSFCRDGRERVPKRLARSYYKQGNVVSDYLVEDHSFFAKVDESATFQRERSYWFSAAGSQSNLAQFRSFFYGKSAYLNVGATAGASVVSTPNFDGRADSTYNLNAQVKGGSAPSVARVSVWPLVRKYYERDLSADMSAATVCPMNDTRGMRVGQSVRLTADSQTTVTRRIVSIIADVSVTLNEDVTGFASYTTGNNARLDFGGFHSVVSELDTAGNTFEISSVAYEPLPVLLKDDLTPEIQPKNVIERVNYAQSLGSGSFSTSLTDIIITNQVVDIETHGNPVLIFLSTLEGSQGYLGVSQVGDADLQGDFKIYRAPTLTNPTGEILISNQSLRMQVTTGYIPPGSVCYLDRPKAGRWSYTIKASKAIAGFVDAVNIKTNAIELSSAELERLYT